MPNKPLPIPPGYEHCTPYLTCGNAAEAIEFYKRAFGATEMFRLPMPDGRIGHAEIKIGGGIVMLSDEFPEYDAKAPTSLGGTSVGIMIYVTDVDAFAQQAAKGGATITEAVKDQFWGDRSCRISDPFGHKWFFATRVEDVSPEETQKRAEKLFSGK